MLPHQRHRSPEGNPACLTQPPQKLLQQMGNRWDLWDSAAGKSDNLPVVLPMVMVVQSVKCVMQAREEGQGPSFPCNTLVIALVTTPLSTLLFHILILALYFSEYSWAVKGGMLRVFSWDRAGIGTNPSGWAVPRPLFPISEWEHWLWGPGLHLVYV